MIPLDSDTIPKQRAFIEQIPACRGPIPPIHSFQFVWRFLNPNSIFPLALGVSFQKPSGDSHINSRCRAKLPSPLRLQNAYLPGTRTTALAQAHRGGAQSQLDPPRGRPPPNLYALCARSRPRLVLLVSKHPPGGRSASDRAFVLSPGLGLGFGHLGSSPHDGVAARRPGAVCGCWPEVAGGLVAASRSFRFRESRALFCFSVSFCVGLPRPDPRDPEELLCAPPLSARAWMSAAARSISEAVCICGT